MRAILIALLSLTALGALLFFGRADHRGVQADTPNQHARPNTAEGEREQVAKCRTPAQFAAQTGVTRVQANLRVTFESGFDEQRKASVDYPVNVEMVSALALLSDAQSISLPEPEIGGSIDPSNPVSHCQNYRFLTIGQLAIITLHLAAGNPYPNERYWAVHTKERALVELSDYIKDFAYLEQVRPDCIRSTARSSGSDPGRQDVWCASQDNPQPRLVEQLMILNQAPRLARHASDAADVQNYYWFRCDRSAGYGLVSDQTHTISIGERVRVTDPDILWRMQEDCEKWANE